MEDEVPLPENVPAPRRSLRRAALTELNEISTNEETPKSTSPDEMVIVQRGRRRKPITWSPVDYDKSKVLGPPRDKTPEKKQSSRPEINLKLRRRLIMSPVRTTQSSLGEVIARKLRSLPSCTNQPT